MAEDTVGIQSSTLSAGWTTNYANTIGGYMPTTTTTMWPYQYGTYYYHHPIRLKMSEIESLRAACKKNKDLREILEKFTDHIEVVVDFK